MVTRARTWATRTAGSIGRSSKRSIPLWSARRTDEDVVAGAEDHHGHRGELGPRPELGREPEAVLAGERSSSKIAQAGSAASAISRPRLGVGGDDDAEPKPSAVCSTSGERRVPVDQEDRRFVHGSSKLSGRERAVAIRLRRKAPSEAPDAGAVT